MDILIHMLARKLPENFMVAFSFGGEQRQLVRAVVEVVERELGSPNVFFDEWFEHYIAGGDADLKLQQIYGERCALGSRAGVRVRLWPTLKSASRPGGRPEIGRAHV